MTRSGPVGHEPVSGMFEVECGGCGAKGMAEGHARYQAVDGEWTVVHGVMPPEGWEFDGKDGHYHCAECVKKGLHGEGR